MRFSLEIFRRSVALLAWSAIILWTGASISLSAADSTPAAASPAGGAKAAGSDGLFDVTPSTADRRINFPDRSSIQNFFNNESTAPMLMAPPAYVPSQRARRMLDNQRNWGFMTPEDVVQEYMGRQFPQTPDIGPDGRDRNSMSAIERYSDRQTRRGMTNSAPRDDSMNFGTIWGNQNPAAGLNPFGESSFKNSRSNPDYSPAAVRPEVLSELLGFRNNPMSPDAIREREAQEKQMDAFKRALNFQPPTAPAPIVQNPMFAEPSRDTGGWNNNNTIANNPANQRNPYDPVAGTYNAALATAAPMAPTAPFAPTAPGQVNPYAPSITPTAPIRLGPPKPDFSIPQRRF